MLKICTTIRLCKQSRKRITVQADYRNSQGYRDTSIHGLLRDPLMTECKQHTHKHRVRVCSANTWFTVAIGAIETMSICSKHFIHDYMYVMSITPIFVGCRRRLAALTELVTSAVLFHSADDNTLCRLVLRCGVSQKLARTCI